MKRDFAYKVKYNAHKLFYGSMKDHYMKVERYVQVLKAKSLGIVVEVVTAPPTQGLAPVF